MVSTRLMAAAAYERAGVSLTSAETLELAVVMAPKMVAGITRARPSDDCTQRSGVRVTNN